MATVAKTPEKSLPALAAELRTALTPVLGYLDLILDDLTTDSDVEGINEQHLQWIEAVERHLHSLCGLSGELIDLCGEWRDRQAENGATPAAGNGATRAPVNGATPDPVSP